MQFKQLRQGDMFVTQYEMRFSELARHAIWLVPIDRERIRRFIDGLTFQLRLLMTRERVFGATFDEVVDIALQIEMVRSQERVERESKRPHGQGGFSGVLSGGSSTTIGVVLSNMLRRLAQFIVVHHLAMVHTVISRAIHLSVPSQLRVHPVLHRVRAHLCQVLLPVIPVLGALFSPQHQHWGFAMSVESLATSGDIVPALREVRLSRGANL